MFSILRHPRFALLILVLGLAGCANGFEFEPQANSNDAYDTNATGNDSNDY